MEIDISQIRYDADLITETGVRYVNNTGAVMAWFPIGSSRAYNNQGNSIYLEPIRK